MDKKDLVAIIFKYYPDTNTTLILDLLTAVQDNQEKAYLIELSEGSLFYLKKYLKFFRSKDIDLTHMINKKRNDAKENASIKLSSTSWIPWIEIDKTKDVPFNVDSILSSLTPFLELLERDCGALCCGIHAFSFAPDDLLKACSQFNERALVDSIILAQKKISNIDAEIVRITVLNQLMHKSILLTILEHIKETINAKIN